MTRRRQTVGIAGLALVLMAGALGCTSAQDGLGTPGGDVDGVGIVANVPPIAGTWLLENTITADTCTTVDPLLEEAAVLQLSQVDTALQFELFDACGALLAAGEGTVTPGKVLQTTAEATLDLTQDCSVTVEVALAGTVDTSQDQIEGSVTLAIAPTEGSVSGCGEEFPCQIEAMFVASPCPPADCSFGSCGS